MSRKSRGSPGVYRADILPATTSSAWRTGPTSIITGGSARQLAASSTLYGSSGRAGSTNARRAGRQRRGRTDEGPVASKETLSKGTANNRGYTTPQKTG